METDIEKRAYRDKKILCIKSCRNVKSLSNPAGQATRFTGRYDGKRALSSKVLHLMQQENLHKKVDKKAAPFSSCYVITLRFYFSKYFY